MSAWLAQHWLALALAARRLAAAPFNTALSLLAIGIALTLPVGGWMLLANAMQLAKSSASTPQISVFLTLDAPRQATQEIEGRLAKHADVKTTRFVPRDETLKRMKSAEGLGDVIEVLQRNPFPDAFVVDPRNDAPVEMERLAAEIGKWPRVEHVQLDSTWVRRLDALIRLGRTALILLALLLGVGLVAITFNTIRLQVLTQRAEIEVSRLLGATDAYIRRPFHYFGMLQGAAGGALAWLITWAATAWLAAPISEIATLYSVEFVLKPPTGTDAVALLLLSTALGWLGAALSLGRHLETT